MSDFLKRWDEANSLARELGHSVALLDDGGFTTAWSEFYPDCGARTMHPSFMAAGPIPKVDPERDRGARRDGRN